ncbi:DWNN domain-containing protein [Neohortaea acidophila]|uniref:DWNN domain-containing protein n=1 Tax=Neohortaea acidophila TaxID=245834 RepID=A0A6A6Q5T2_9PEZI|nr:DWNN domain-containing protein [Neohortaea acidophila]KAF2487334.1 DWNN domain-containing protein [Neohortaea acidophila]
MSSSIFFRFKSQKDPLQITFDGTSLSVFEVKREIIALSKLGDGTDFDLDIYSADGKDPVYDDDTTQIPRSTTVIARRHPSRPGAGRAARYVTGKMPVNAKNAHRIESIASSAPIKSTPVANNMVNVGGKEMSEEEKLQALLSANDQSWRADQASMSHKPVVRSTYNKSAAVPDKPLPPGYLCHRCGEKGHWIQACPTNNDPNFDNRKKIKRTTGIPRSFLKAVEKPPDGEEANLDPAQRPKNIMYTADGEMVTFEPDNATWEKIQEKQHAAAEKAKVVASDEQEVRDRGLECSLHNGIFVEPTKTPCCERTFCNNCIESALLDSDLKCPSCETQPVLLDQLQPDEEVVAKLKAYEEEKKAEKEKKQTETTQSPAAAPPADSTASTDGLAVQANGLESGASTPNGKKRAAEDELPNDRKPSNPAAAAAEMKKTGSSQGKSTPTGPAAASKAPQPPIAPAADLTEFHKQMQAMSASMGGMQNGMPAMMNPMMGGFNPMMMGMPPMPGMPGMSGMPGMPGMPMMGMPGMNMPNFNGGNMNMNGWHGNGMGPGNWQGGGGMGRGGGMQGNGNDGGAYMRQPVNPNRHRGKYQRPRSADYRQI